MDVRQENSIVTGASGGIGAGLVEAFLKEGYNVVGTSLSVTSSEADYRSLASLGMTRSGDVRQSPALPLPTTASPSLVLVEGDIGEQETAAKVVEAAIQLFGSIDVLVNNAGIFCTKPFTDFTTEDFNALVSTNLLGFLYITQLTVK
jgi:NAD(P)-dependent dehydrogenase (short-subunit alcohol dehydrogenase family)